MHIVLLQLNKKMKREVLGNHCIMLSDYGNLTLKQVQENQNLTLLCSDIPLMTEVAVYSGVMSVNCTMINQGDFVKFSDSGASAIVNKNLSCDSNIMSLLFNRVTVLVCCCLAFVT